MAGEDELFLMELNLHPNEASGLLTMGDGGLLGEHGWDLGFWAVLDEGEIEDCVAAIGHRRGSPDGEGWEIERLRARVDGKPGKTEDAEAITLHNDTGYATYSAPTSGARPVPCNPNAASSPASARPTWDTSPRTRPCTWKSPVGASRYIASSTTRCKRVTWA